MAKKPMLRIIGAWESPVNAAVENIWASRKVKAQLRPAPTVEALASRDRRSHASYPLLDRSFDLSADALRDKGVVPPSGDVWVLEVSYEQIAEHLATIEFSQHQRVGFAMELVDEGERPQSPQAAMQALPQAVSMVRLTIPENRIANPIVIKPRV
jgi:hypothetical protein